MFPTLLDLGVVRLPRHNSICIGDVLDERSVNHLLKSRKNNIPRDTLLDLGLVRTLVSVQVGFCPRASMPPPRNHGRAAFYKRYSGNQAGETKVMYYTAPAQNCQEGEQTFPYPLYATPLLARPGVDIPCAGGCR